MNIKTFSWFGRVVFCKVVLGDDTLPTHTILWLVNRKATHYLVIEANLEISFDTKIEVIAEQNSGEVLQIVRPAQITRELPDHQQSPVTRVSQKPGVALEYFRFFSRNRYGRPFAVKLTHDVFFKHNHRHSSLGYCAYCTDSSHRDHWFAMTPEARRIYVAAQNIEGLPDVIAAGADYWEQLVIFLGQKGLIHPQYHIATIHGWQNRLFRIDHNSRMKQPLLRVTAHCDQSELDLLSDSPFVTNVKWLGFACAYQVAAYARDENEEMLLLDWISRFKKHSLQAKVIPLDCWEVLAM